MCSKARHTKRRADIEVDAVRKSNGLFSGDGGELRSCAESLSPLRIPEPDTIPFFEVTNATPYSVDDAGAVTMGNHDGPQHRP